VNRARAAGLDPELELRAAALDYADRVRTWAASQDWQPPDDQPLDEQPL
jgi:XTP/dITP diphosphohydrolase